LVSIVGKSEAIGKPILYGTSNMFMDYFGINNLSELPQIKDFTETSVSIGEQTE
jgi:segregation and condensation protein B